tara:strand:- start:204 stop:461 length:258 start_codon:yes stop_codon:yes gene_type:complete
MQYLQSIVVYVSVLTRFLSVHVHFLSSSPVVVLSGSTKAVSKIKKTIRVVVVYIIDLDQRVVVLMFFYFKAIELRQIKNRHAGTG